MTRPGKLRHCLTIEQHDGSIDTSGNLDADGWETYRSGVYCDVRTPTGAEATRGGQVDATLTHAIDTRYNGSLTAQMRATDYAAAVHYYFVAITNDNGRRDYMTILARSQA